MSEIDIAQWKSDIESATDCMCEIMINDDFFENNKHIFDYVIKYDLDAEVAEWVLGAVNGDYVIDMYDAIAKESKKLFEIKLLGTY